MTSDQFRAALYALGLTQGDAAAFLGKGLRTINGWARAEERIPVEVALLLVIMLHHRLSVGDVLRIASGIDTRVRRVEPVEP